MSSMLSKNVLLHTVLDAMPFYALACLDTAEAPAANIDIPTSWKYAMGAAAN